MVDAHFLVQQKIGAYIESSLLVLVQKCFILLSSPIPIHLSALFYYSPQVISFGNAENCLEIQSKIVIDIIDRAIVPVGYCKIDTNFKALDTTFSQTWFIGLGFKF